MLAWILATSLIALDASSEIYQWTDESGRSHFSQDLDDVPRKHRARAEAGAKSRGGLQTYSIDSTGRSEHPPSATPARYAVQRIGGPMRIPFERASRNAGRRLDTAGTVARSRRRDRAARGARPHCHPTSRRSEPVTSGILPRGTEEPMHEEEGSFATGVLYALGAYGIATRALSPVLRFSLLPANRKLHVYVLPVRFQR